MTRLRERVQNGVAGVLSLLAFVGMCAPLLALTAALVRRARGASLLADALRESLSLAAWALPPALVAGIFLAMYWAEYHEQWLARLGQRFAREMAKLPDLFVAVAIVALLHRGRSALVLAVFIPALVFVATSTLTLLGRLLPVYRSAALALGVPRHRWIASALLRIAPRPLGGIALLAFGRVLTTTTPLLVLMPTDTHAPLALLLLREQEPSTIATCALVLLAIVLVTKIVGRAMLGAEPESRFE